MFHHRSFSVFVLFSIILFQLLIYQNAHAIILADSPQPTKLHYSIRFHRFDGWDAEYAYTDAHDLEMIITATNVNPLPNRHPVEVELITMKIPKGDEARDLVISQDIQASVPEGWECDSSGVDLIMRSLSSKAGEIKGEAVKFTLKDFAINSKQGTVPITITEKLVDGTIATATLNVNKFPKGFYVSDLQADPTTVLRGRSTTLSWDGSEEASYSLEWDNKSQDILPAQWSYEAENLQTNPTRFTLTATLENEGLQPLTLQKQTFVEVLGAGPHLMVDAPNFVLGGDKIKIRWNTTNAKPGTAIIWDSYGNAVYKIEDEELSDGYALVNVPIGDVFQSVSYKLVYQEENSASGEEVVIPSRPVKLKNLKPVATISVGKSPVAVAISQDDKKAYVANSKDVSLTFIDLEKRKTIKTIPFRYRNFMQDFDLQLTDIQNVSPTDAIVVGKQVSYYVDVKNMKAVGPLLWTALLSIKDLLKYHLKYIAFGPQIRESSRSLTIEVLGAYEEGPKIRGKINLLDNYPFPPIGKYSDFDVDMTDYKTALYSRKYNSYFSLRNVGHGQEIEANGYVIQTSKAKDDASFMTFADGENSLLVCNGKSRQLIVVDLAKRQVMQSIKTDPMIETILPINSTPYAVARTLDVGNPARNSKLRFYNYKEGRMIRGAYDVGKSSGNPLSHHCMAATPDGKTICVCNPIDNTLTILSIE